MASNELMQFGNLKENLGVPNAIKANSARKTPFGISKKNILGDVKNTLYAKETRPTDSSVKKQLNANGKAFIQLNTSSVTHGTRLEPSAAQEVNLKEEEYYPEEDCVHCNHDDQEELWDMFYRQSEFRISDDDIDKLCLDPNPKERYAPPTPERDFETFCKELSLEMPSDYFSFGDHIDIDLPPAIILSPKYYAEPPLVWD